MKKIKAACLMQTICFQSGDGNSSQYGREQVQKEYELYKERMAQRGTAFKVLEESTQPDGSILVKLKKQNNQQPVGDYFD